MLRADERHATKGPKSRKSDGSTIPPSGGKGGGEKGRRKVERDLKESSCFLLSPAGLEGHNEHNELNELQNQLTN